MNLLIKTVTILCLGFTALIVWIGCMFLGFLASFTQLAILYHLTPFIGLIGVICIILTAMRVSKSDPMGKLRGKAKVQL